MTVSPADGTLTDDAAHHRYILEIDGRLAGQVVYLLHPGRITLLHTEVEPEFEGEGVGSRLAKGVLDDVRRRGLVVKPQCPFIAEYISRHPGYADLVDGH